MIKFKRIKAKNITPELNLLFKHCCISEIVLDDIKIIEIACEEPLVYIIEDYNKDTEKEYDAILDLWDVVSTPKGSRVRGRIKADSKKRFPDGQFVQTTPFIQTKKLKEGDIIQTKNSTYKLGVSYNY